MPIQIHEQHADNQILFGIKRLKRAVFETLPYLPLPQNLYPKPRHPIAFIQGQLLADIMQGVAESRKNA